MRILGYWMCVDHLVNRRSALGLVSPCPVDTGAGNSEVPAIPGIVAFLGCQIDPTGFFAGCHPEIVGLPGALYRLGRARLPETSVLPVRAFCPAAVPASVAAPKW